MDDYANVEFLNVFSEYCVRCFATGICYVIVMIRVALEPGFVK
jgi:hypothetical protein